MPRNGFRVAARLLGHHRERFSMSLLSHVRRTGMVAVAVLAAAIALALPASAAGATPAAQAQQLQARADFYLAKMGGVQVAPDRIDLGGATVHLLAPDSPAYACAYRHMCAYHYINYAGEGNDVIDMEKCGQRWYIPWVGRGSWINNQTPGTRARFYDTAGNLGWTSPGAYTSDPNCDWGWVGTILPC
jgi:hypothetical protein